MSHHHNHAEHPKKRLHQDWRFIVGVILMLIAIATYVMTMDDRIVPVPEPGASPSPTAPAKP